MCGSDSGKNTHLSWDMSYQVRLQAQLAPGEFKEPRTHHGHVKQCMADLVCHGRSCVAKGLFKKYGVGHSGSFGGLTQTFTISQ